MYQQPPSNYWQPGQFLPPAPPPKPTLRQRFNQLPKRAKLGLGCSTFLIILAMCVCSSVAANTGSRTAAPVADAQPTAAPTQAPTSAATLEPTKAPTAKPTAMAVKQTAPTPIPTQAPTPKPVPTQPPAPAPTQAPKGVNGNPLGYNLCRAITFTHPTLPSATTSNASQPSGRRPVATSQNAATVNTPIAAA